MLELPGVTLACVDTVNHALALRALARSSERVRFARTLLLTDALPAGMTVPAGVDVVPIAPLRSRDEYSRFVLKRLAAHVATPHVLLVQWDGFVVNPDAWDPAVPGLRLPRRALVLVHRRPRRGQWRLLAALAAAAASAAGSPHRPRRGRGPDDRAHVRCQEQARCLSTWNWIWPVMLGPPVWWRR